jgi:NADPH:quinone reductase-like Zn-dependent oxidoreductase
MKSCWIKSQAGKTVLEFRDIPVPQPKAGEIVVRMRASSLNRGELLAAIGLHSLDKPKPAGSDVAGEVHAVGEGVTMVKPGDRVMGRGRGAFAEYTLMPLHQVVPMPQSLNWEQAAAVSTVFVTTWECLCQYGRLRAGEWLLVAGASSGVGVACIQAAKVMGAKVIGTSGSAAKLRQLQALGLDVGIEVRGGGFAARVLEATDGKGVNLAVNLVGGSAFPDCLAALANQGRLAIVGYVDNTFSSEIDISTVHAKRLEIFGVSNMHLTADERASAMAGFVRDFLPAFGDGRIVPVVDKVFDFDDLPAAKAYVDSNAQIGKVVVRMD